MDSENHVRVFHMMRKIDKQFIEHLTSHGLITRSEQNQLQKYTGKELLDQMFLMLQRSQSQDKVELFCTILRKSPWGDATIPYIGCMVTGPGPQEDLNKLKLQIQKNRLEIKETIQNLYSIVNKMTTNGWLGEHDVKVIFHSLDSNKRMDDLINAVIQKGLPALEAFMNYLKAEDHDLASKIEEMKIDGAGQVLNMGMICLTMEMMMAGALVPLPDDCYDKCKTIFLAESTQSRKYRVQYCSARRCHGLVRLVLRKLPGYSCNTFLQDLLDYTIAGAMGKEALDNSWLVLDVNICQLDDQDNASLNVNLNNGNDTSSDQSSSDEHNDSDDTSEDSGGQGGHDSPNEDIGLVDLRGEPQLHDQDHNMELDIDGLVDLPGEPQLHDQDHNMELNIDGLVDLRGEPQLHDQDHNMELNIDVLVDLQGEPQLPDRDPNIELYIDGGTN